jgi:hypothetical protein
MQNGRIMAQVRDSCQLVSQQFSFWRPDLTGFHDDCPLRQDFLFRRRFGRRIQHKNPAIRIPNG